MITNDDDDGGGNSPFDLTQQEVEKLIRQVVQGSGADGASDEDLDGALAAVTDWKFDAMLWRMWSEGTLLVRWDSAEQEPLLRLPEEPS